MMKNNRNLIVSSAALLLCTAACIATEPARGNLQKVYAALELKQADHDVLGKLTDGTENIHENEFFWMMKKISTLPPLSKDELAGLDAPSWNTLVSAPQRFRFLPVRMTVCIYTSQELTTSDHTLIRSPYWPSDKPIYRIHATNCKDGNSIENEPLVIFSQSLPPALAKVGEPAEDGQTVYKSGPIYEVSGIFYKYITMKNSDGTLLCRYPVILSWQMNTAHSQAVKSVLGKFGLGIILLIVVLAITVFMFLKKRIRNQKADLKIKSMFRRSEAEAMIEDANGLDPMSSIPAELAQAAKQYRLEHPEEDDPKNSKK